MHNCVFKYIGWYKLRSDLLGILMSWYSSLLKWFSSMESVFYLGEQLLLFLVQQTYTFSISVSHTALRYLIAFFTSYNIVQLHFVSVKHLHQFSYFIYIRFQLRSSRYPITRSGLRCMGIDSWQCKPLLIQVHILAHVKILAFTSEWVAITSLTLTGMSQITCTFNKFTSFG